MIVNTSNNGGNAASFNSLLNTNAIVTIPHHAQLIPAALTIEIWARPQLNLGSAALISKLPSSSSTQVGYAIKQAGNKFRFSIGREGNEQYIESGTFFLGPWYHLTCTYDGSTARIYVNGILQGSASISSTINSTTNITVGNVGSLTESYKGLLDELRIWGTVKDPATIQCNYRITTTPTATNLVGYWQMNEATSGATPDATANQNHGVIANGTVLNSSSAGVTNLIIWDVAPGIIDINSPCVSLVPQATTTYKVTAINSFGCASTDAKTIVVYPPINEFAVVGGGIWCTGTPGLPVGLPGSQVGVSYQLKNGSVNVGTPVTGTGAAITLANISTGGLYTIEATANGCLKTMPGSATVTVKQSPVIFGANITNVTCNSGNDGAVDITVTSGTPAFSYVWSNSTATQDATNLTAGSYYVTVSDVNGCKDSDTFNITEPTALLLSSNITNVACFGQSNASITLTTGGTPPLNFSWSNSATSQNLSGISAGIYTVNVSDAAGCIDNETFTVTQPTVLTVQKNVIQAGCFGGNNGSIDLTANGGVPPYSYSWSNNATTEDISGLSAGSYTVTINHGTCTYNETIVVGQPAQLNATATPVDVSCNGTSDGSIDLVVTGGTAPYTYNWSNNANTQDLSNLSAGTYSVTITDNNGCTTTASATVGQPATVAANGIISNVGCFGSTNGGVNISVSGGTAPFTYAWSNNSTSEDLANVGAGAYSVVATDANGCSVSANFTISQPAALVATVSSTTNATCTSAGAIDLSVTGGSAPYTYSWSNNATTQDLSNIPAGTYNATVTDANGCATTQSATITQPAAVTISHSAMNVSCFGQSNGGIDITVTGGSAPFTYSWSNNATTQDISGLAAGSYSVTVTDVNGCTGTHSVTITQPAVFSINGIVSNVSCFGADNGSIDIMTTGGTTPYTYSWSNNATSEDLSNLAAGSYSLMATDASGCSASANFTVSQPTALAASIVGTMNVSCNGGNNGSIDLAVTGGIAPYTYSWSNSATAQDLSNIGAGTYNVTITDGNGCTTGQTATITQPNVLSVNGIVSNATSGNNGSIDITATGGTAPYVYSWSNNTTAEDLTGLAPGSYTVTVTDSKGCSTSGSFTVTGGSTPLNISGIVSPALCFGDNSGVIDVTVTGGTAPYTYDWSFSTVTTQDRTNLYSGFYHLEVTDANNQTEDKWFYVAQPWPVCAFGNKNNVTCNGGNNGSITLSVYGGTAPYTYSWSNNSTSQNQSNLAAGTYSVTITDANGCTKTLSFTVSQPAAMNAAIAVSPIVTVTGGQPYTIYKVYGPQSVTLSASAAGGAAPYTYSWQGSGINGVTTASVSVSPASTQTYSVTVTDANGCSKTVSRTITVINVSSGNNKVKICHNGNTISVSVNAISAHLNHGCKLGDCSAYGSNKQSNTEEDDEEHDHEAEEAAGFNQLTVKEIIVYPNPSSGNFTLQLPHGETDAQVLIMDATGRTIAKHIMTENTKAFDLSNVAQGMYNIQVVIGTETYRTRVVIQ